MKAKQRNTLVLLLLPLLALAVAAAVTAAVVAQPHTYNLFWWTVDGGGGTLQGDGYALNGIAGQPDAAFWSGGGYALGGGFWGSAGPTPYAVYLPLVLRGYP